MSEISSKDFLTCKGDPYGGVTVNSTISLESDFNSKVPSIEQAQQKLKLSLDHWVSERVNGVWFEIDIKVGLF